MDLRQSSARRKTWFRVEIRVGSRVASPVHVVVRVHVRELREAIHGRVVVFLELLFGGEAVVDDRGVEHLRSEPTRLSSAAGLEIRQTFAGFCFKEHAQERFFPARWSAGAATRHSERSGAFRELRPSRTGAASSPDDLCVANQNYAPCLQGAVSLRAGLERGRSRVLGDAPDPAVG